jgi:ATP-dependent DNA helicase RecG
MINVEELKQLLHDLESDRVERTTSKNNTDKFSEAVCAFANDLPNHGKPGYLIVGVHDNGALANIEITDQLLQNLAALRSDGNIQPIPQLVVEKFNLDGQSVAVVEVQPALAPPVRYKGRCYVRVGPRKATASEQEERTLTEKRMSSARTFDATIAQGSGTQDLSLDLFTLYRKQVIDKEIIEASQHPGNGAVLFQHPSFPQKSMTST